jgi:hypothetical protein
LQVAWWCLGEGIREKRGRRSRGFNRHGGVESRLGFSSERRDGRSGANACTPGSPAGGGRSI